MADPEPHEVTTLLMDWRQGDEQAGSKLIEILYGELHGIASRYLGGERRDHTLQTTALVNELYLRLFGNGKVSWENRAHFFAVSAQTLRRILIDHARSRSADKRSGKRVRVALECLGPADGGQSDEDLLAIDQALGRLAQLEPRSARVVELRFFAGLTEDEVAEVLGVSIITVKRDWRFARAWLMSQLLPSSDARA